VERCIRGFGGETLGKDPAVDGRIILRWISGSGMGSWDWIDLAQGRDRWWALVNVLMNLHVL
jgi:hypothetical protein